MSTINPGCSVCAARAQRGQTYGWRARPKTTSDGQQDFEVFCPQCASAYTRGVAAARERFLWAVTQ